MALLYRDPNVEHTTSRNSSKIVTNDPLAIIFNEGLWRLNKVTPMYKLEYMPVKLKMYASKIKQAIVSSVQDSSAKYSVKIEELPNLRYSEDDCSGLKITVTSSLKGTKEAFVAIFLSWGQNEKLEDATHLPYMLERGEQKVGTAMKSIWQTLFDCCIKQYSFSQQQLLKFGFNFLDSDTYRSNEPFTFVYKTPQIDYKEKLSFTFDVGDISIIWTGMNENQDDMTHSELVDFTYQILQNQIFHLIPLDITVFDICEIRLPKAEIKSNGAVKMKSPEIVNCVFTILNEISGLNTKIS